MSSIGTGWLWAGFFVFILSVIFIDIFLLGKKKAHRVSTREALSWAIVWIACALIFNFLLWWYLFRSQGQMVANEKALEFLTGFLVEKFLSVDNMFVFLMIFSDFAVPPEYQRRVLLYGELGAIVMRLIVILLGTWLILEVHWVLYLFGLFILITGIKMLFVKGKKSVSDNVLLRWLRDHVRVTDRFHGEYFFIYQKGLMYITPLFLVLVLIEASDLIFALDSIPAIFAVTEDPFIVFTSNIFALLGLRSLYFLLANMADRFYLLKSGIAVMLSFIGVKMLIVSWVKIPTIATLGIVLAILVTSVILSLLVPQKTRVRS